MATSKKHVFIPKPSPIRRGTQALVSLSKTTVECKKPSYFEDEDEDEPVIVSPSSFSLSSKTSSFFDLQSFPSHHQSFTPRTEFEHIFEIPTAEEGESSYCTRLFVATPPEETPTATHICSSAIMSLRRYATHEEEEEEEESQTTLKTTDTSDSSSSHSPISIPHSRTYPPPPSLKQRHTADSKRPSVKLEGRLKDTPKVLSTTLANQLRPLLPVHQRLAKSWKLCYSMDQHGISFNTMLGQCPPKGALLMALKDTRGKVFGAYLNEPLRLSPSFYGQGTCFLWKAYRSTPEARKRDSIKQFKYTGDNEYFVLCDPDFVAIGGGRGKFGLWFKSDFLHGYSAKCPTFNNQPLCLDPSDPGNEERDAQKEFVLAHIEIWSFNT